MSATVTPAIEPARAASVLAPSPVLTPAPPRPGGPDAKAAEELLRRMRWSAGALRRLSLDPHAATVVDGAGLRLLHVTGGSAVLRSRREDDGAVGPLSDPHEVTLQAGDVALLPHAGRHELHAARDGGACVLTAGLTLEASPFDRVSALMPTVLFTCGFRLDDPAYAGLVALIDREVSAESPTSSILVDRLIDVVVSAALRAWLERGCGNARAWLAQAHDPHLGRALEAIHAEPGSSWRVEDLARLAHSSRSQFAERFRSSVGESPARYVTGVRMRRAEELLRTGRGVSEVAFALGYDSDEGFSRAFRRHSGLAPSEWRRRGAEATAPVG
ncbi:transcriptional regulator, AraC family [Beutenbergia cavernae DSM 12333]|uniref:Transcriptional regulator, AraC family n=1 Tax=Beutenbergia cavernae (strain ATCC BAA-8 / DSM 12333 / CCUG 43141 / JCM 11478 / NBRC 16432 / NCIMB 13614 / HKI 0122) TaxID=471853 RepID=C5C0Z0_BEUC1|nr:AraC family transcriptional regulator [Beutenbergia cavernae]ACQ79394.1 transcriptional regulator, AraC family [Beutenbergia cavernae DSM 12333]